MDAVPHSMVFLLGTDGLAAFPVTSQHLLADCYADPPKGSSYPQLRRRCRDLLMVEWQARTPDPVRYPYRSSLKHHPFMGLNKFDAGRLHQMRSGNSNIRAHPSWDNDDPTTCDESLEMFEHAILPCPARAPTRDPPPLVISDLGSNAPICSSATLLSALS